YLLLIPGLLLLIVMMYPFLTGVYWSFNSYKLTAGDPKFNWGKNYLTLFTTGDGLHALGVTFGYALMVVVVQLVLGVGLALLLNYPARFTSFFRILIVMPLLLPPVIAALMWKVMMTDRGVLNYLLGLIGLPPSLWTNGPETALFSVGLIDTWVFTPFVILLVQAGLKSVPHELYEASSVDGAGPIRNFWNITLPMMTPVLMVVITFRGIDSLKMFDIIYTTTKGGPVNATTNLHVLGYLEGIRNMNFGAAMAALVILWVLCYVMSNYLLKLRRKAALS
ncbi:MAG: sugar ABC transporter permease, partial [Microbacterium sp.]